MTDDLKLIVLEVNRILKSDYNLISFDSMSQENLLQILVDILCYYEALTKFDVKFTEREETTSRILESLKKIQFRMDTDKIDPVTFRKNIVKGDKKTIYVLLKFIFQNKDKIKNLTYLAKFLLPIQVPNEALSNPDVGNLWEEYINAMEQFKVAHRGHTESVKEISQLKELRNDINAIEAEKDNVTKRIDRTQTKLDKIPNQELLLEAANVLRIEKDRQKELMSQLSDQNHDLTRFKTIQERLKKELTNARIATQSTSPQYLMEQIQEETQVMEFLVKQKLPKECNTLQKEISLLENIVDEPNITKDYLNELQSQLDKTSRDVQRMVENKVLGGNQNDSLIPFRQQAATVAKNKELAAEQLNEISKELRETETQLHRKQNELESTIGDVILRGDDLKQYVNRLRAKSSVYKKNRSELASVKAEISDLTQTLENLKSQDPNLSTIFEQSNGEEGGADNNGPLDTPDIENRGLTELARIVEGLKRAVFAARDRLAPISQKSRPLREQVTDLKDERDSKKKSYDSLNTTLKTEASILQGEIVDIEKDIKNFESNWQELKSEQERAENLLDRVRDDKDVSGQSLKESLKSQIMEQEKLFKDYQDEKQTLFNNQEHRKEQLKLWNDVQEIFEIKANSLQDRKNQGYGGTLSINKNSETFILQ